MSKPEIFFIMISPLPSLEKQSYGPAWWDMNFVKVNDKPVPYKSREDAEEYMRVWGFKEPQYSIWQLEKV